MKRAANTIIDCLKEQNMSQRQLASFMGEDVRYINQQLNRQKDMKVERFVDVLSHIGYRLEIVENDGIRKVAPEYAELIVETKKPIGKFWFETEDGLYHGITCTQGGTDVEKFTDKEACFKWLKGEISIPASGISSNV